MRRHEFPLASHPHDLVGRDVPVLFALLLTLLFVLTLLCVHRVTPRGCWTQKNPPKRVCRRAGESLTHDQTYERGLLVDAHACNLGTKLVNETGLGFRR